MSDLPCPGCNCDAASPSHALAGWLLQDDVDRAIGAGLLQAAPCDACTPVCAAMLARARDERRAALAARERFRARERRLAERAARREASRRVAPATALAGAAALPSGAAAALQRALARARGPA